MIRTIDQCHQIIKNNDPDTAISKYMIRCIAKSGQVKTLAAGKKILIDFISLGEYLGLDIKQAEVKK